MQHAIMVAAILAGLVAGAQGAGAPGKEGTKTARGTFDVKLSPQPADDGAGGSFARLFVDKQFHGDLEGASKGQMLASGGPEQGSGGYVALELVSGTLHGKRGSFVLQHRGTMSKGGYQIDVTVVPDSGKDELAGIFGTMTIVIEGKKHSYEFAYTLAGKPQ